jgi:anti-sigma-K factor RskA
MVREPYDDHPVDDLAAYALGSLDSRDQSRVESHLAGCARCGSDLHDYRAVLAFVSMSLPPVAPPPEAWSVVRAATRPGRRAPRSRSPLWRRVAVPALTAVAASLVIWNVVLQRDLARYTTGPQIEALARRPGRMVILSAPGATAGSARLFIATDGGHGHMAVAGLRALPPGRTYQLWFLLRDASARSGGVFNVDARGRVWATVDPPASLDETQALVVTDEPVPGNTAPQGQRVLQATSWR